ncbi:MAG TPA: hypothetical protein DC047_05900 [Blastocatellia bacterium]|nr:hypothetical protein [Blastocatellia bacterium]
MSKSYQYYADATLKSSHDLLTQHYDRAYSYDHGGRMTKALSGAEARGEAPTNDRPYYLGFSYDAFDHSVYEDGRFWTSASALSFSYQNNRRADATYDADGNVLNDSLVGNYGYDAAGNVANSFSAAGLAVQNFDGDGRSAKSTVTSYFGEDNQSETTTKYYVRSSVLNGKVLSEVNETGAKLRTFIYLGNQVLAWQRIGINNYERVVWEHRDPSGASYRVSDETQSTAGAFDGEFAAELDPSGANEGIANPNVAPPPNPPNEALLGYPGNGNPSQPGVSYTYNGVPMSRNEVMDLTSKEGGEVDGKTSPEAAASVGLLPIYGRYRVCVEGDCDPWQVEITGYSSDGVGSATLNFQPITLQKPDVVTRPIGGLNKLQAEFEKALKYSDCREAMSKILAQMGSDTKFAPSHTDILDLFNALKNQTGGGGIFVDVPGERINDFLPERARGQSVSGGGGLSNFYYTDPRNWRTRQRWSAVFLKSSYANTTQSSIERQPYEYVVTLIHEITHNAPNDSSWMGLTYTHNQMNAAAEKLGSKGFDQYVKEHCIPKKYR